MHRGPHARPPAMLRKAMTKVGLDEQRLINEYRLVVLDANKTLDTLLVGDRIDASEFCRLTGDLLRLLGAGGREVHIVGEMVDVLTAQGRFDAAIQLEELCNDLSREHVFRMYCLYCEKAFNKPPASPPAAGYAQRIAARWARREDDSSPNRLQPTAEQSRRARPRTPKRETTWQVTC